MRRAYAVGIMDPGFKLIAFVVLGTAVVSGAVWAFKKLIGTPKPDPTDSPGATPFSPPFDGFHDGPGHDGQ